MITEEQWQEAERHAKEYQNLYMMTPTGMIGAVIISALLRRYNNGERTEDLYERMMEIE